MDSSGDPGCGLKYAHSLSNWEFDENIDATIWFNTKMDSGEARLSINNGNRDTAGQQRFHINKHPLLSCPSHREFTQCWLRWPPPDKVLYFPVYEMVLICVPLFPVFMLSKANYLYLTNYFWHEYFYCYSIPMQQLIDPNMCTHAPDSLIRIPALYPWYFILTWL